MTCPHSAGHLLYGQPVCQLAASYARQLADAQAENARLTARVEFLEWKLEEGIKES